MKRSERQSVEISSQPNKHIINRQELLVDFEGEIKRVVNKCTDKPIPTKRYVGPSDMDMSGKKFGTFTVIGPYAFCRPGKKARWVCKCSCGMYEIRLSRSIRNPNNQNDRCHVCRQVLWVKQHKKYLEKNVNKQPLIG